MLCPICKKPFAEPSDPKARSWLPFCSDRCKLIDLGRWLGGVYQIPVSSADSDEDGSPPLIPDERESEI